MATKRPKTKAKRKSRMPKCNHMADMHSVQLPTIAVLSLVIAATHAVRNGLSDDDSEYLEPAVNALLDQCFIDCDFDEDGNMCLTYDADAARAARQ